MVRRCGRSLKRGEWPVGGSFCGSASSSPSFPVGLRLEKLRAAFRVVQNRLEAWIATQSQEGRARPVSASFKSVISNLSTGAVFLFTKPA
jgi:hypothetical protein